MQVETRAPIIVAGNQTISVATGADSTLTPPAGATHALITADSGGGGIRYWEDGSSPTTTTGLYIPPGGAAEVAGAANLTNFRARATSGTVAINVSYRKYA